VEVNPPADDPIILAAVVTTALRLHAADTHGHAAGVASEAQTLAAEALAVGENPPRYLSPRAVRTASGCR
jgi:hypothetical protein